MEAGLRTHDIYSPWPEEFNRQAVDIVSEYYFAPTEASKQNLLGEGKLESGIWVTGNTGIDALRTTVREATPTPSSIGLRLPPHPHHGASPRELG